MTDNHHMPTPAVNPTGRNSPNLVQDPAYILTVGAFALITTGLPAALGQLRFMPIIQALSLAIFLGLAVRRGDLRAAYMILGVWVAVQFGVMLLLTLLLPPHLMERAIVDGFSHRQALLEWIYTDTFYPGGILAQPVAYLIEIAGIVLGSLATGGLVGLWFFARLVNLTAYTIGSLVPIAAGPFALLMPLVAWPILRIIGYACLIPILAAPLLTGNWSSPHYWRGHRRQILLGIGLVIAGIVVELLAAPLWSGLAPDA